MTDPIVMRQVADDFGRIAVAPPRSRTLGIVLLSLALVVTLMVTGYVLWQAQQRPKRAPAVAEAQSAPSARPLPAEPLPAVEPLQLKPVAPVDAKRVNAAVPFSIAPNPPARSFVFSGEPEDLARATDCLAAAVLYEAGDDAVGERAVAQVVLNRMRHPAFPHTVCDVVFQGHERRTGCQFTFTCDGALARLPLPATWQRARAIAAGALAGGVFAPIGLATHYHTDWVVPYWSASLDKIAAVKSHLFFRWSGGWGQPRAFIASHLGPEPRIAALALVSEAHREAGGGPTATDTLLAGALPTVDASMSSPPVKPAFAPTTSNRDAFLVTLGPEIAPDDYPGLAADACGARPRCVFMAWSDPRLTPDTLPAPTSRLEQMSFEFLRDPAFAGPRMRWDCTKAPRSDPNQCLNTRLGAVTNLAKP